MPLLSARIEKAEYREGGKLVKLTGPLAGVSILRVVFYLDDVPFERTRYWSRHLNLIAPGVTACLRNLRGDAETIVLHLSGSRLRTRQIGRRASELPSAAEVYLDYVIPRKVETYEWFARGSERQSVSDSRIVFEVPDKVLDRVVRDHYELHSFKGYILESGEVDRACRWAASRASGKRRRADELELATVFFEDSPEDDGGALKLWSKELNETELRARINLPSINRSLGKIRMA